MRGTVCMGKVVKLVFHFVPLASKLLYYLVASSVTHNILLIPILSIMLPDFTFLIIYTFMGKLIHSILVGNLNHYTMKDVLIVRIFLQAAVSR